MLWMFQRVMFGPVTHPENKVLSDLSLREICVMLPMIVMIFWMGIYPKPFLSRMEKSIDYLVSNYKHYDLGIYEKHQ